MMCTGWTEWMSHRKLKETKQQPGTARPANILGCCLVYLCFLCDIHSIHSVTGWAMINLLIFLYDGRCWLWHYSQPLQHLSSHLGRRSPCPYATQASFLPCYFPPSHSIIIISCNLPRSDVHTVLFPPSPSPQLSPHLAR